MKLVVDANVLFSALIKDRCARYLLTLGDNFLHVPEFIFEEIYNHLGELEEKTGLKKTELIMILKQIISFANIEIYPFSRFKEFYSKAREFSPDANDAHYFALAMKLNCPIWSNDKALKAQNEVEIHSTADILKLFKPEA